MEIAIGAGLIVLFLVLRTLSSGAAVEHSLHFDPDSDEPSMARIRQLADSGQKIQAIKAFRALSGASLSEAKDAVEAMKRRPEPVE